MRNKLQVESLVQACRLQPSVVPGVACSSVRSLKRKRAWAVASADRRVKPDPAESSPEIVGNAACKVTGRRSFPAWKPSWQATRQVRPANIGSGRNPVPFWFPKALDRWRRFTLKRLRALAQSVCLDWFKCRDAWNAFQAKHANQAPRDGRGTKVW